MDHTHTHTHTHSSRWPDQHYQTSFPGVGLSFVRSGVCHSWPPLFNIILSALFISDMAGERRECALSLVQRAQITQPLVSTSVRSFWMYLWTRAVGLCVLMHYGSRAAGVCVCVWTYSWTHVLQLLGVLCIWHEWNIRVKSMKKRCQIYFKSMLKLFLFSKHYGNNLLSSFTI